MNRSGTGGSRGGGGSVTPCSGSGPAGGKSRTASRLVLTFALLGMLRGADLRAAGYRVIHEHSPGPVPANPSAGLVSDPSGVLYGTSQAGGSSNLGTVYAFRDDGSGLKVLHSFVGGPGDGSVPDASLILDGSGTLYGTTSTGGTSDLGTVFSMKTDGTGYQLLHSFAGGAGDGSYPHASLTLDASGHLYGTTVYGGTSEAGVVFRVKADGTGYQLLHSFAGGTGDGSYPYASLTLDAAGYLYGTTFSGGASNLGSVFRMKTDGKDYQLAHSFAGGSGDGSYPEAPLVLDADGIVYGTTVFGGALDYGTIFRLKADGTGFQLLHMFTGPRGDGVQPKAALILDGSGNLFGTTRSGGPSGSGGTVFRVRVDGTGFELLHTFTGPTDDGWGPYASLMLDGTGNLYGATFWGGATNLGALFRMKSDGTAFQLLCSFGVFVTDGISPYGSLTQDAAGNFYGTTYRGGASNQGTVFRMRRDGSGFEVLHSFAFAQGEGKYPAAGLVLDSAGNLYGTTFQGGAAIEGTVFRMRTDGTGFQVLHSFAGGGSDGSRPYASLTLDEAGTLYGTTSWGGPSNSGTVFSLKTDGTGFRLLYASAGSDVDATWPFAPLILDGSGYLYGTSTYGGRSNGGTVFKVKTDGTGFQVLHSFAGDGSDGSRPYGALTLDDAGNLYGTTREGGPWNGGTVFSLRTDGAALQFLHLFEGGPSDGRQPMASLILDGSGNLYGTTAGGGAWGAGTVFGLKSDGTGYQVWHSFGGDPADGRVPPASLTRDAAGSLYGTTHGGGLSDSGVEFTLDSPCLAPAQPGAFTSSTGAVCSPLSGVEYAVPNDPSATYTWSYSGAGATITGTGSSVTVAFSASATSGKLSVRASNACGVSPAQTVLVAISPGLATPAPTNDGPKCEGGTVQLSVGLDPGATYSWTGPNGFTSTRALPTLANVTAAMAGDYFLTEIRGACTSAVGWTTVVVHPVPATPAVVAPDSVLSATAGYTASVPAVSGATYAWTISNGTITQGATTPSITFTSGTAGPLKIGATVTNEAGCASLEGTRTVTVLPVGLYTVTPCRAMDTRNVSAPALAAQETRTVLLTGGACGIPPTAKAVALNLTAVTPVDAGFLTFYPGDQARAEVSSVNFRQGQIKANNAIVKIGADGTLGVFNMSAGMTNVVVDVVGYFQ